MATYFDNNTHNLKWKVDTANGSVKILVDHKAHTHTLDITKATVGQMLSEPDKVLGDAHRAASHDKK